jgi:NADH:ubiquinone oxidoreductase subunit 6 (subunit J)
MKNDFKKIYWTIVIIWGTLASICSLLYAVFFENASLAPIFWNLSYWTVVIFIAISIISALGFALSFIIKGFMDNPKKQMKIIIAFAVMIILLVATYLLASGTDIPKELFERTGSNYGNSKLIGGSLYAVYVLMVGVIIAALYSEIAKKFR